METPQYEERVKKKVLNQIQPVMELPKISDEGQAYQADEIIEGLESSLRYWVWFLSLGLLAFISFSLVDAYLTVVNLFAEQWILGVGLAGVLIVLIIALFVLIYSEAKSFIHLKAITRKQHTTEELKAIGDKQVTLSTLESNYAKTHVKSPACKHYRLFTQTIKPHHTNDEILQIYQDKVQAPLLEKARIVLRKENISAGAVSFFSPNSLLQTVGILWISMRTLKRVAFVYGLRPSLTSNLRLFRIALENLAASSLTDLVTDEIANQLGGSIGDKVIANSADAITAVALNQRLGKALIRVLSS